MGCCQSLNSGEDYLRRCIQGINIWEMRYSDIKFELENSKININDKNLFIECFQNYFHVDKEYKITQISIFSKIWELLDKNTNKIVLIHNIIFYLFSFLDNNDKKLALSDFIEIISIIKNIKMVNIEDLKTHLNEFYKFNLITISEIISSHVKQEDKKDLEESILKFNENLKFEIEEVFKGFTNFKEVDSKIIDNLYSRIHFSFWELRSYFLNL